MSTTEQHGSSRLAWIQTVIPLVVALAIPAVLNHYLPATTRPGRPLTSILGVIVGLVGLGWLLPSAKAVYFSGDSPVLDRPPHRLITSGPYRCTRNPMALGMSLVLLGEALFLWSAPISAWGFVFIGLSHVLAVQVEEPSLRRVFPEQYAAYEDSTPRWVPSLRCILRRQSAPQGLP